MMATHNICLQSTNRQYRQRLNHTFTQRAVKDKPKVLEAHTVKGKGITIICNGTMVFESPVEAKTFETNVIDAAVESIHSLRHW